MFGGQQSVVANRPLVFVHLNHFTHVFSCFFHQKFKNQIHLLSFCWHLAWTDVLNASLFCCTSRLRLIISREPALWSTSLATAFPSSAPPGFSPFSSYTSTVGPGWTLRNQKCWQSSKLYEYTIFSDCQLQLSKPTASIFDVHAVVIRSAQGSPEFKPIGLTQISYYVWLPLNVVSICASRLFGSVRLQYVQPTQSTSTTKRWSKDVGVWMYVTGTCWWLHHPRRSALG